MNVRNEHDLQKLASDGTCRVFLVASPGSVPFWFAIHPWFVVCKDGIMTRWEILHTKNMRPASWDYLYRDFLPPLTGMRIVSFIPGLFWKGAALAHIEGSVAERIAAFLEECPTTYPYRSRYVLQGPNSNTFAAWVLRRFPEWKTRLPGNAFGKNF